MLAGNSTRARQTEKGPKEMLFQIGPRNLGLVAELDILLWWRRHDETSFPRSKDSIRGPKYAKILLDENLELFCTPYLSVLVLGSHLHD